MNEIQSNALLLKSFANNFLNKFLQGIKKDSGLEHLGRVIYQFVMFRNDDLQEILEIQ